MTSRSYRPGQFGIFTVLERGSDLNSIITSELATVSSLRLKKIEWIDLGSQIVAILFSSFRSQIYLSEWQQLLFKSMFKNTSSTEMLRDNSRHVVKIIAAVRQQNSLSINLFEVKKKHDDSSNNNFLARESGVLIYTDSMFFLGRDGGSGYPSPTKEGPEDHACAPRPAAAHRGRHTAVRV